VKKMKNKILIKLYVPTLDFEYEIFIPTNEIIKKVVDLIVKSVDELCDDALPDDTPYYLFDPETSQIYANASVVRDTNIINDKKIILI